MATPDHPGDPPLRTGWLTTGPFGYTDEGEGPTLVLIHGLPGSGRDFRWLAPALNGARVVRIDQPGYGSTPTSTAPGPHLEARATFLSAVLDALDLTDVTLVGHSMGGPIAIAAACSPRVSRLGLLASVGLHPHRLALRTPRFPDLASILAQPLAARAIGPLLRAPFHRAGFPRSTPDAALVQTMRVFSQLSFDAIRRAARAVECETLIAWTEDDPVVEPAIALELANALPDGPRLPLAVGGHNLQKSQAVEVGEALRRFVYSSD